MKIYYVEDEANLAEIIKKYLIREGYDVTLFYDGESAMERINDQVDLWILDINLPGDIDGFQLITKIKEVQPTTSVIFTSARDKDMDKVEGLELGSDDYLAKPFAPRELILRVKAVLRRNSYASSPLIHYETYEINTEKREIKENDNIIRLTNKEYELLAFFISNKGEAFEREVILKQVWGPEYFGNSRVVDDLLRRLRQKMPKLRIETIYGHGYRLL
ncbi:MAG: response regulator transcription factor [Acholeplasmataceae bacterium]|jgi:two-component system response regulator CssR|nr:response regulator transcription factor [Acholeplasmataceae bacterium]